MNLSTLCDRLASCERMGADADVRSVAHDSRKVEPGALFVALRGAKTDGHDYIAEAARNGAAALALNADRAAWYGVGDLPALVVPDTRRALPHLAAAIYGEPSRAFQLVGVTGTNGKTTTTAMIESIFRVLGDRTGRIGTLGAVIDGRSIATERTTPESSDLQRLFADMRDGGVRRVVMEVSSEGILAERTAACAFDIGVFTNLTQDHLNTHGTMESYFSEKRRLFTEYPDAEPGKPFRGVINGDDPYGRRLIDDLQAAGRQFLVFSLSSEDAPLTAEIAEATAEGTRFTIVYRQPVGNPVRIPVEMQIGGLFNVANALAAAGVALLSRVPPIAIRNGLEALSGVPGRFERVPTDGRGFQVIVDYAHSPDGLDNVLRSARALRPDRLICVFGCGGDRDPIKRPQMGRISTDLADLTIVTSDNPRSENPNAVIADILAGIDGGSGHPRVVVEADRRLAIEKALCEIARPGDLIVIAGKGHETGQILADRTIPFDDRQVAREVLTACS